MLHIEIDLKPQTEQKIKKILDRHSDKEVFFQDIIQKEIGDLKNGIINIEIDLLEFEKKYSISSEDFYRKFENGEMGDEEDFILWAGVYEMQLENRKRLAELE